MSWLDGVRYRLRAVVHPGTYDSELDDEMSLHEELDAQQQGDRRRARRRFGNRTYYKEEVRRMTWLGSLDVLRQDMTYAWRSISRTLGVTITIVLTLALGIGLNAATFAVLDRLYVRAPSGIAEPATLRRVWVEHVMTRDGVPNITEHMNYPQYRALADATGGGELVALYAPGASWRLGRSIKDPEVRGAYAAANYFSVLGVRPVLGRLYTADEDRLGNGAAVAVVSDAFWRRVLQGDANALGKSITLHGDDFTVIGVLDPAFRGLDLQAADVWLPLSKYPQPSWMKEPWWESQNIYAFQAIRRLQPGVAADALERRATTGIREVARVQNPTKPDTLMRVHGGSIVAARGPGKPGQELLISTRLSGVALIVLLIAAANVINLLLARAVHRRRETAVRLALGISRWRVVRLITTETMLLAGLAALAALVAARWGGTLLRALLLPDVEWTDAALDLRVVLFTFGIALVSGLVAGIVPALQSSNPDLTQSLKAGAREGVRHRSRLRSALVIVQTALSVMLLIGAALFVRSLRNVQALDIGYDAPQLVFGGVTFEEGDRPHAAVLNATMREIVQRLENRPGIEAVARAGVQPMRGYSVVTFFAGADSATSFPKAMPTMSAVSPGYFAATGIRLLHGRELTGPDRDGAPAEVIVNDDFARLYWPNQNPLGQCVHISKRDSACYNVVGVAENVRRRSVIGDDELVPQFYLPLGNLPNRNVLGETVIVRAQPGAAVTAASTLRAELLRAFPAAEPNIMRMTENLEPEYRPWRLGATLFTAFGVMALIVALIGIYTTISYGVNQRTHEFGVRVALGAGLGNVLRQVVGEGLRVVTIGIVVGIALALAAGRLIAALLYGIEPDDPSALLLVAALLLVVTTFAALIPAWRAGRVDPLTALRSE